MFSTSLKLYPNSQSFVYTAFVNRNSSIFQKYEEKMLKLYQQF